jgi:DNA-binding NarL/FixJ family response regulator
MASLVNAPAVVTTLRGRAGRPAAGIARVVVLSDSAVIGDGIAALLPREWRDRIRVASGLDEVTELLEGPRTALIVDGDAAGAAVAILAAREQAAITILLQRPAAATKLGTGVLDAADAVLDRDTAEPLTLRIAIAAGRMGMRLVPRLPEQPADQTAPPAVPLSDAARQVLALLAEGKRDAEIALILSLSESAVRKLVQRTVRAVGARTRCQAVAIAARRGELAAGASRRP